jgi:hypothetical protein
MCPYLSRVDNLTPIPVPFPHTPSQIPHFSCCLLYLYRPLAYCNCALARILNNEIEERSRGCIFLGGWFGCSVSIGYTSYGNLPCHKWLFPDKRNKLSLLRRSSRTFEHVEQTTFGWLHLLRRRGNTLRHAFQQRCAAFHELGGVCPQVSRLATDYVTLLP